MKPFVYFMSFKLTLMASVFYQKFLSACNFELLATAIKCKHMFLMIAFLIFIYNLHDFFLYALSPCFLVWDWFFYVLDKT